tara:strand:- start:338 stop:955 length:618 start_codon:yes stop_codon:yes gene_type:complete
MKIKIGIIDYSIGNWGSLRNALLKIGFASIISQNHDELKTSDLLMLPGVGAYKPAIKEIKKSGLNDLIYEISNKNKPIIGICLGMQLLGRSSLENEYTEGLNLIPEDVIPIERNSCHIGWNNIKISKGSKPLINQSNDLNFYFNHSYGYPPDLIYSVYETTFKKKTFTSVIKKGKIVGLQFHPEKSQKLGLKFLKELILNLCSDD